MKPPIADEEWDFARIPDKLVQQAMVYEYCRSAEWVRAAIGRCTHDIGDATRYTIPAVSVHVLKRRVSSSEYDGSDRTPADRGAAESRNSKRLSSRTVFEIWTRRAPRPGPYNPFLHHDQVITLSCGFPRPYLSDPQAFARLEIHEGLALPAVHDLGSCMVTVRVPSNHPFMNAVRSGSKSLHKMRWIVSEPNGAPIEVSRNDHGWRRFALALDMSRSDEMLVGGFARFLKAARQKYSLPVTRKKERLSRAVPLWINLRYCWESLEALSAYRLIEAFDGNQSAAFRYRTARLNTLALLSPKGRSVAHYVSSKEFGRAARRYGARRAELLR